MFRRFATYSDMDDTDDDDDIDEHEDDDTVESLLARDDLLERQSLLRRNEEVEALSNDNSRYYNEGHDDDENTSNDILRNFAARDATIAATAAAAAVEEGGGNPQDDSVERHERNDSSSHFRNSDSNHQRLLSNAAMGHVFPAALSPPRHLIEPSAIGDTNEDDILKSTGWLRSRPSSKDGAEAALVLMQQPHTGGSAVSNLSRHNSRDLPSVLLQNTPQNQAALLQQQMQQQQQQRPYSARARSLAPPTRYPSTDSSVAGVGSTLPNNGTNIVSPLGSSKQHNGSARCVGIHCMATVLLWSAVISLAVAIVWYSYELFNHGTDPHLIAWFSAGAFVILGFPISMWGILGHLTNYNAPEIQVYIVRILWMVPIYSIESWLAMRFTKVAVYIETARDVYESFVLYCFLQFLIQVLGGEEALVLMLKDKSPTRGVHMWGLQWFGVKPWLMGQPVRREDYDTDHFYRRGSSGVGASMVERVTAAMSPMRPLRTVTTTSTSRVTWTSPFFIKCKFGVLQYVLIKILCAMATLLLEWKGWYKEGQFHYTAGYLYICFVTNVSQCWALYCLIFFYYATKTELSPIRPVGKFLSVKALVFFTWWQSVFISSLYQMDMIPTYSRAERIMSSDDVAKSIQDYLICIEMFAAAIAHSFVFPHSDYSVAAVRARANAIHQRSPGNAKGTIKRLGRRRVQNETNTRQAHSRSEITSLHIPDISELELIALDDNSTDDGSAGTWEEPNFHRSNDDEEAILLQQHYNDGHAAFPSTPSSDMEDYPDANRPGFFRAFLDSAIPRDLRDNTVNIMRGDYNVEKKTLLHHAATSDQYELFSARRALAAKKSQTPTGSSSHGVAAASSSAATAGARMSSRASQR